MIDVILTTYNRLPLLKRTVDSLVKNTTDFRLFINDDCSEDDTRDYLLKLEAREIAKIILNGQRKGVVPGFNALWEMVEHSDSEYVCYLQDDMLVNSYGWLDVLTGIHKEISGTLSVGFASGYDAREHPEITRIQWAGREVLFKNSTSATNLIATKHFWRSLGLPIPLLNPNGRLRGFPNDGHGSNIDVYLTGCISMSRVSRRDSSPTSSYKQGKVVMVIPGLLEHLGAARQFSSWRQNRASGF
jgi:glycosyltransferase involved in cell wall biosynthesis